MPKARTVGNRVPRSCRFPRPPLPASRTPEAYHQPTALIRAQSASIRG